MVIRCLCGIAMDLGPGCSLASRTMAAGHRHQLPHNLERKKRVKKMDGLLDALHVAFYRTETDSHEYNHWNLFEVVKKSEENWLHA